MTNKTSEGAGGLLATRGRKIAAAIAAAFIASIGGGLGAWAFQAAKDKTGDILDTSAPISVRVAPAGRKRHGDALAPKARVPGERRTSSR